MSSNAKVVGYCRACGKPLDETTVRNAHGTIYCEEHLPMETAPPGPAPESSYASPSYASPYTSPYTQRTPPAIPNPDVAPGLAFVLGFIPGVGAIYNGQYAKGLVHVIIIGLMISILSNGAAGGFEPLMGLLLATFWLYMPFEAFHTAKKRAEGQPVDEFSSLVPLRGASKFPVAPVMLIVLGVVFLLDNLEIFDLRRALRYWPVLLILLGGYMLFMRMSSKSEAERSGQ
jgi:Domain of unknown function (DUF5668)